MKTKVSDTRKLVELFLNLTDEEQKEVLSYTRSKIKGKNKDKGIITCDYCGEMFVEGEPFCPFCGKEY